MFDLTLKKRTGECIRRGCVAMLTQHFIDQDLVRELDMSDEARAALHFECHAQTLFVLHVLLKTSIAGSKNWANLEFFVAHTREPFAEADRRAGLPVGTNAQYIVPRFLEIGRSFDELGDPFIDSIAYINAVDHDALRGEDGGSVSFIDDDLLLRILSDAAEGFHKAAASMFTRG
jgi:hypothetical protein